MIEFKITEATPLEALAAVAAFSDLILHSGEEIAAAARGLSAARLPSMASEAANAPANPTTPTGATTAPVLSAPISPTASPIPAAVPAPATAATTAPAPTAAAPVMPAVPLAGTPMYTLEQLAHAGAELVARNPNKMPEAQAVLARFGVDTVSALDKSRYGEFATALRAIGAVI